ncbi:MAG: hypothetical protein FWD61_13195 [Phycisphaerales bacterium]|nr:hypothetical protein [Phycisphaerales bacterium]
MIDATSDVTAQQSRAVVQGEDFSLGNSPRRRAKTSREHDVAADARNSTGTDAAPPTAKDVAPPASASRPLISELSTRAERDAARVRRVLLPSCLAAVIGKPDVLGDAGIIQAFEDIVADAGAPTDPIERMMLEQLILCHYRLAILQAEASGSKTPESVKIYNAAATRLMSELRKFALALRDYRLGPNRKSVAFIRQQNVAAAGGSQTVEYRDQNNKESFSGQSKLNNPEEENLHELRERVARSGLDRVAEPTAVAVDA